ncbi:Dihydrofolate reductase [Rathayibacter oskolensis]|uniref:Dihydrofolate reductase n=1 Tax=Rathayibacter oskolensis TaxID=1891671 RepID=A0A1X7NIB8_9MICO|nr:dihydrofolate reductase family protein [Rathayibacter oskolensis]SMH37145.1 Dihydrofolate reductase [Rathayibacter oskolensis]
MGRISAMESISLDGVMQGLGRPDEDTRDDFAHGGWGEGYQDDVSMRFVSEGMTGEGAMLFGRRTYEDLLGFWTTTATPNPFTDYLTHAQKFVVSRSAGTELTYPGSTLLAGDAVETVGALHESFDGDLTVLGSGALLRDLHRAGLVDEYILQIHPILLGSGQRLFGESERADLVLQRSVATTTGVLIAQYSVERRRGTFS